MKKSLALLLVPSCLCIFSCGKKKEVIKNVNSEVIEDVDVDPSVQHATSLTLDPNAPFYLKIGETRDLKATLSPSPTLSSEKEFTWKAKDNKVKLEVDNSNSAKATVTGLTEGKTEVTATNIYNPLLSKTFVIEVIEFNEENNYLWQYDTTDHNYRYEANQIQNHSNMPGEGLK